MVAEIKEEGKKIKQKRKARKMLDKRFELFKRTLRDEGVDKSVMKVRLPLKKTSSNVGHRLEIN